MRSDSLRLVLTGAGTDPKVLRERLVQIVPRIGEVAVCERPAFLGDATRFGDYHAVLVDWAATEEGWRRLAEAIRVCTVTPVLVVSHEPAGRYAERVLRMGAQDYLVKRETRAGQLLRAIYHAVERKRLDIQLKTTLGELGQANARLRSLALKDVLTGALNRRAFSAMAGQALARAARDGRSMALLYCDLDGFKGVNDSLGHAVGDQVLVEFCRRVTGELRRGDCIARLGGDEFVVLMETRGEEGALEAARRIRAACSRPLLIDGHAVDLRVSIGIAEYPRHDTVEALIRAADQAMYEAKAGPGVAVASSHLDAAAQQTN
jgi:diguanylate cyclase (GGDEF)-like protein